MRKFLFGGVAAAMTLAAVPHAIAMPADLSVGTGESLVSDVQYRRHGFHRPWYGHRQGAWYGHRRSYGAGAAAGIAGLAAGALIGSAIANAQEPAYLPAPDGSQEAYCMSRFKSYDPGSGTYLGYDGLRHPCP